MTIYEFEVWLAGHADLKAGRLDAVVRKYVVAANDTTEAYRTALAMAWRGDLQVTQIWWVP